MALFLWQQHCDPHTALAKETPKLAAGGRDVFRKFYFFFLFLSLYLVTRSLACICTPIVSCEH